MTKEDRSNLVLVLSSNNQRLIVIAIVPFHLDPMWLRHMKPNPTTQQPQELWIAFICIPYALLMKAMNFVIFPLVVPSLSMARLLTSTHHRQSLDTVNAVAKKQGQKNLKIYSKWLQILNAKVDQDQDQDQEDNEDQVNETAETETSDLDSDSDSDDDDDNDVDEQIASVTSKVTGSSAQFPKVQEEQEEKEPDNEQEE